MSKHWNHRDFVREVRGACNEITALLTEKNKRYGNAALDPARIFSKASSHEQLLVRIDDKLNRIKNWGTDDVDEDTLLDLMGYLVLLRINMKHDTGDNDIRGPYNKKPLYITVETALQRIQSGKQKQKIERVREGDKEAKKQLPVVLWSGRFKERKDDCCKSTVASSSLTSTTYQM